LRECAIKPGYRSSDEQLEAPFDDSKAPTDK
jgi:hypothetical protein